MSTALINALNYVAPPIVNTMGSRLAWQIVRAAVASACVSYTFGLSAERVGAQALLHLACNIGADLVVLPWIKRHAVGVIALSPEAIKMSSWLCIIGMEVTPIVLTNYFPSRFRSSKWDEDKSQWTWVAVQFTLFLANGRIVTS